MVDCNNCTLKKKKHIPLYAINNHYACSLMQESILPHQAGDQEVALTDKENMISDLHTSPVGGGRPGLGQVVDVVVDVSVTGVVVRPQRRQHGKALLLRGLTFGVAQHVLVESVWIPTREVQSKCDVAIRVDLKRVYHSSVIVCHTYISCDVPLP